MLGIVVILFVGFVLAYVIMFLTENQVKEIKGFVRLENGYQVRVLLVKHIDTMKYSLSEYDNQQFFDMFENYEIISSDENNIKIICDGNIGHFTIINKRKEIYAEK